METKKLHICLKHIPDITYTLNIYYIVLHYKEFFFKHIPDTAYIWCNCSAQRKVCLKHIPDITFTLNIHDMFAMYTRWNIYTNQKKVKNYTSWNIKTKPMTLITYTSRCRKLHLKLLTLPTCSNGWNWGVAHCRKVWGPCYFSPLGGWDSLVPLELACKRDT